MQVRSLRWFTGYNPELDQEQNLDRLIHILRTPLILSNLMFHHGPSHGFLRANDISNSTNSNSNGNCRQHFLGTPVAGE